MKPKYPKCDSGKIPDLPNVEQVLAKKQKEANASVELIIFIERWQKECDLDNGEAALILLKEAHDILSKMCKIKNSYVKFK